MRIFVDTSIILAFLAGQDDRAWKLLKEVENREIIGYINPLVVDEVVYGYLRLAARLSSRRIRELLAGRDERHISLVKNYVQPVLRLFTTLPLTTEPEEIIQYMEEYGPMPADAIIALTCKQHGINTIATLDEDFE